MGASVFTQATVGAGALALTAAVPSGTTYRVISVTTHLSAAPTSAGSLTITLDAKEGSDADTLLLSQSMVGITDLVWEPEQDLLVMGGDAVDVVYANPDNRTYGVRITLKAV